MKKTLLLSAIFLCTVWISYGQWTYTNLSEPKSFMGSAALGNKAYFAGGYNGTSYLSTVEVYDVTTGTCEVMGNLSAPREIIGGGISCGSKVFFPGGFDWSASYSVVDIYDTATGQWTTGELSQARFSIASVCYQNKVMFAGGFVYSGQYHSNVIDIYDTETGEWTVDHLTVAREGIAAAVVGDLAIFAGGITNSGGVTDRVDIYDFADSTWRQASLSQARGMANATTVGNLVVIAGGVIGYINPTDVVDIYDAATNTWSTAALSFPRSAQTNDATVSGKAFFAGGGEFMGNGFRFPSDVIDIYDPQSDTWSVDHLSQPLINHSVLGIGGYLIVAGGENDIEEYYSRIEVYHDPTLIHVPADYSSIQEAINSSSDGDTVLVDDGTYYENINFIGRKPLLVASQFMIDGDTNHINNTIINGSQPVNPDIGSVVTFESGEDTTSVLYGFTITGGSGTLEPSVSMRMGGGLHIKYSGGKFLNNHIRDNNVLYAQSVYGGGMQLGGPIGPELPWMVLRDNKIFNNNAISISGTAEGGGFVCFYHLIMENNEIYGNKASGHLGGNGGGVSINASFLPVTLKIRDNYIAYNKAMTDLGTNAFATLAGGMGIYFDCSGVISNNIIEYNVLEATSNFWSWGAGVFFQDINSAGFIFENNIVSHNNFSNPYGRGGGVSILRAGGLYQNNVIMENTGERGGGFHSSESQTTGSTAILINNTIAGNHSAYGGGFYSFTSNVNIINSIIWGNTASNSGISIYHEGAASRTEVYYSDVENTDVWPGEGNINANPGFQEDGYHIDQDSPCEDQGAASVTINDSVYYAPLYDFEGNPRPWHYGFDMGADEVDIIIGLPEQGKEVGSQQLAVSIWPNPTSGSLQFAVRSSQDQHVTLNIYDVNSREVAVVFNGEMAAGEHVITWDSGDLPSGIYYYRLTTDDRRLTACAGKLVKF